MIELGKHATPVLLAYGVTIALLLGIVVQSLVANARARRALEAQDNRG